MNAPALPRLAALAALVAVAAALFAVQGARAATPAAQAAATCDLSKDGRKLGATYVTLLKVRGVSCSKGKRVVKAFNGCRRAHGGADGRCTSRVLGFSCKERRSGIDSQYDAKVTCKAGTRSVIFNYTQFT
jgi:hypothetical protein